MADLLRADVVKTDGRVKAEQWKYLAESYGLDGTRRTPGDVLKELAPKPITNDELLINWSCHLFFIHRRVAEMQRMSGFKILFLRVSAVSKINRRQLLLIPVFRLPSSVFHIPFSVPHLIDNLPMTQPKIILVDNHT